MKKLTVLATLALALLLLSCGDSSVNINGSDEDDPGGNGNNNNNNNGSAQTANAIIITLLYWESKETDGLFGSKALDPRISFIVTSVQGGKTVLTNKTGYLLNADDLGQTWSGSSKSSPISFTTSADKVCVDALVEEKDGLINDDISPGEYKCFPSPFTRKSGTMTFDYGSSGKSKVRFDYEFVWR